METSSNSVVSDSGTETEDDTIDSASQMAAQPDIKTKDDDGDSDYNPLDDADDIQTGDRPDTHMVSVLSVLSIYILIVSPVCMCVNVFIFSLF